MNGAGPRIVLPAWVVALLLLLGSACSNDAVAPRLISPGTVGRIEGRVTAPDGAGGGLEMVATGVGDSREHQITATTWTDSTGAYSLTLPYGDYTLTAHLPHSPYYYYDAGGPTPDSPGGLLTLHPGQAVVRADFQLGSAEIVIATPTILEGKNLIVRLETRSKRRSIAAGILRCSNGEVRLAIPFVAAGLYVVHLSTPWHEDFYARDGDPGLKGPAPADDTLLVRLAAGRNETFRMRLADPTILHGVIEGVASGPAGFEDLVSSRPEINTRSSDSESRQIADGEIELDGSYWIPIFGPATTQVRLAYSWNSTEQWIGGATAAEATLVDLVPGGEIEIPPVSARWIVMQVSIAESMNRINSYLHVFDLQGRELTRVSSASDSYGSSVIVASLLGEQPVYLRADPSYSGCDSDWIPTWYPGVDSIAQAQPVTPQAGGVTTLETELLRGGSISGTVELTSGYHDARIILCAVADTSSWVCDTYALTDDPRTFRFRGLPDGAYLLGGYFYGETAHYSQWYPRSRWASGADTLWIRGHTGPADLRWVTP